MLLVVLLSCCIVVLNVVCCVQGPLTALPRSRLLPVIKRHRSAADAARSSLSRNLGPGRTRPVAERRSPTSAGPVGARGQQERTVKYTYITSLHNIESHAIVDQWHACLALQGRSAPSRCRTLPTSSRRGGEYKMWFMVLYCNAAHIQELAATCQDEAGPDVDRKVLQVGGVRALCLGGLPHCAYCAVRPDWQRPLTVGHG